MSEERGGAYRRDGEHKRVGEYIAERGLNSREGRE